MSKQLSTYLLFCFFAGIRGENPGKVSYKLTFLENEGEDLIKSVFPVKSIDFDMFLARKEYFDLLNSSDTGTLKKNLREAIDDLNTEDKSTKYAIVKCVKKIISIHAKEGNEETELLSLLIQDWNLEDFSNEPEKPLKDKSLWTMNSKFWSNELKASIILVFTLIFLFIFIFHQKLRAGIEGILDVSKVEKKQSTDKSTEKAENNAPILEPYSLFHTQCEESKNSKCILLDIGWNTEILKKHAYYKNAPLPTKRALYIDTNDISYDEYSSCIKQSRCNAIKNKESFFLNSQNAKFFCAWKGKRIPTQQEMDSIPELGSKGKFKRCVMDSTKKEVLAKFDTKVSEALSSEQLNIFHNIQTDNLNKPVCKQKYRSPENCRDPVSYLKKNEFKNYIFSDFIENISGGYVGVAADANYSYIAHAKSTYAWLFDFDINIVRLHKILKALILNSSTPAEFVNLFKASNVKSTSKIIENYYSHSEEAKILVNLFKSHSYTLYEYYRSETLPDKRSKNFGWLKTQDSFAYIKEMYSKNRINILPGDMLKGNTMRSIGESAFKLGIPIRIYYASNVEIFWKLSDTYKSNVLGFPFDDKSVVISTVSNGWHKKGHKGDYWHYMVRNGKYFQRKLLNDDFTRLDQIEPERVFSQNHPDMSFVGF